MTASKNKPLLTKADLPLDKIAEICRRWNIHEMAVDTGRTRPPARQVPWLEPDPFDEVDLHLIVKFDSDKYEWHFNEHHFNVVAELQELMGVKVWITDNSILEKRIAEGAQWAIRDKENRDVIYSRG
jgi:hypothetical protein